MSDLFISREQAAASLLDAAAYIGERIRSSDGHATAMDAVIPLYLERNDVDLAAELANAVDDPFSRDKLLTAVAEKCAQIDDDEYALQLAEAIEDQGLQAQAFERIGTIKAAKGDSATATEIAQQMVHPDQVYAVIAVHEASSGNEAGSENALEEIEYPAARVHALTQIAMARIGAERYEEAVQWLDRALVGADDIEHDEEKLRALTEIGNLFIDAKRNDKAVETFSSLGEHAQRLDSFHKDGFLVNSALGFLHAGSDDMAEMTLDHVKDKTQMAAALTGMARHYWGADKKTEAVETLDEAYEILRSQREIEIRDARARTSLIGTIAALMASFENAERGIQIALDLPDEAEQASVLTQVAHVLMSKGEDEQAHRSVDLIDDEAARLTALVYLADAKERKGETAAANELLDQAFELSGSVPQLVVRTDVLNGIAERLAAGGEPEKARRAAVESLNVISQIRDESTQASALAALSAVYTQAGIEISDAESQVLARMTGRMD